MRAILTVEMVFDAPGAPLEMLRRERFSPGDLVTLRDPFTRGKPIEIGSFHLLGSKAAQVFIALIVRDNEQDVRRSVLGSRRNTRCKQDYRRDDKQF